MSKISDQFVRCCVKMNDIPAAALCIMIFLLQSVVMDYYLVHRLSIYHLAWIGPDAVNLTLLIVSMYLSKSALAKPAQEQGSYSVAWLAWLTVSSMVACKCIVIFNFFAEDLEEDAPTFFGPNTLKTAIALGSCVFVLLLTTQHNAPLGSDNRRYIEELTGTVIFDLLDTVDILEILFDEDMKELLWEGLKEFILFVATLNLLIPTIPLLTLSRTGFGRKKLRKRLIYLHRLLLVILINFPNLLVRMFLWHGFSVGISPFSLKNIILIIMTFYEFYEHKKEKYEEHEQEKTEMREHKNNSQNGHGSNGPVAGVDNKALSSADPPDNDVDFSIEERMVTSV